MVRIGERRKNTKTARDCKLNTTLSMIPFNHWDEPGSVLTSLHPGFPHKIRDSRGSTRHVRSSYGVPNSGENQRCFPQILVRLIQFCEISWATCATLPPTKTTWNHALGGQNPANKNSSLKQPSRLVPTRFFSIDPKNCSLIPNRLIIAYDPS